MKFNIIIAVGLGLLAFIIMAGLSALLGYLTRGW